MTATDHRSKRKDDACRDPYSSFILLHGRIRQAHDGWWAALHEEPPWLALPTVPEQKHAESFRAWDCGERIRRAALRMAALVVGSYQVGSVGFRLIGFEEDRNSLGEAQPRTCWVFCDSVPVCCHRLITTVHTSVIIGFSSQADQKLFASCHGRSDTTRHHRRTCSTQSCDYQPVAICR